MAQGSPNKKRKYRIACKCCKSWLANLDILPEETAVFNCGRCKKAYELKELDVQE